MAELNIVTCGDEAYSDTMLVMVGNIGRLYPGASIWIYDWGLADASRRRLAACPGVKIVDWQERAGIRLHYFKLAHKAGWRSYMKLVYRWPWTGRWLPFRLSRLLGLEFILIEKIRCFLDVSERIGNERLVFFDGDAMPIRPVDALLDPSFDLTLTIRRPDEFRWEFDACTVLNSGVIGFGADAGTRRTFLRYWLRAALDSPETIAEQTALTRIIEQRDRGILRAGGHGTIDVEGAALRVQVLPGDEYNFDHIEELVAAGGGIPESIQVLHFKNRRFRERRLRPIIEQADLAGRLDSTAAPGTGPGAASHFD